MNNPSRLAVATAVALLLASAHNGPAQTTEPATRPSWFVSLTLTPMAIREPSLGYPLLPPLTQTQPGNAATLYDIARSQLPPDGPGGLRPPAWGQLDDQLDSRANYDLDAAPPQFDPAVADEVLEQFPMHWLDVATHRDRADWDVDLRGSGFMALLPYLNSARTFGNVLSLQAKLQISRAQYADAARSLQSGFAFARHLGADPVPVQGLVACGIELLMFEHGVQNWVQQPDAPNLYWSLSALPVSLVNLSRMAEVERASLTWTDPQLAAATLGRNPNGDHYADALKRSIQFLHSVNDSQAKPLTTVELSAQYEQLKASILPLARADAGHNQSVLSDDQLAGEFLFREYDRFIDRCWQACQLPYAEGAGSTHAALAALKRAEGDGNPLLQFIPRIDRLRLRVAEPEQRIAALRVVEAIRDYVTTHEALPASLDEIANVPVPDDPISGKPFRYERAANPAQARLWMTLDDPIKPSLQGFDLTLKKTAK